MVDTDPGALGGLKSTVLMCIYVSVFVPMFQARGRGSACVLGQAPRAVINVPLEPLFH